MFLYRYITTMRRVLLILIFPIITFGLRYKAVHHHNYQWVHSVAQNEPLTKRREIVISALKKFNRSRQSAIIDKIVLLKDNGDIRWFHPLWLADVILFDGNSSAAQILRKEFPQYKISPELPQNVLLKSRADNLHSMQQSATDAESALSDFHSAIFPPETLVWNAGAIGILEVWKKFGTYGNGVLVSTFDTGLDRWVPDIVGAVFQNPGESDIFDSIDDDDNGYPDDIWGYNFWDTTSHPYDDKGHGTHLAGTIVGRFGTGLAPAATIVPLKVLNHSGVGVEGDVWIAIEYAVEIGALVGNFSIGWRHGADPPPDRDTWRTVLTNAIEAGFVPAIAAGNESGSDSTVDDLRTPGDVPEVITVGAVDSALNLSTFSSIGPVEWDDFPYPPGLIKPDICAFGSDVESTVMPGGYERWDGTSMATPHITAICALMRQINPELSAYDIKAILESTAVDLGTTGKDNFFGSGMVNIFDALMNCAEMETVIYSATVSGTLTVLPQNLLFFGDGDTIFIPHTADYFVFHSPGFVPETLDFDGESGFVGFAPTIAIQPHIRVGIMDFDTGEPIDGSIFTGTDTVEIHSTFTSVIMPSYDIPIVAQSQGYTTEIETLFTGDECLFFFLHRCIDFEDSATFSGTMDWEWGEPAVGPENAHSGSKLWATALADTYRSSSDSWLASNWVSVGSTAAVYFWQWFDCEATNWGFWDGGNILCDFGSGWQVIYPIGDYPCHLDDYNAIMPWEPAFSGTLTGNFWHQKKFPLFSVDEPGSVRIAFHFSSDDNTTRAGWFIDDVCIAKRTVREPIIRSVQIFADTIITAAYGVSAPIADAQFLYPDESTSPMEQFACDSFSGIVAGAPGDTVRFKISIIDGDGREALYPADSFLIAVKPLTKISEHGIVVKPKCTIEHAPDGFRIDANGDELTIFNISGKKLFDQKIDGEKNFLWQPKNSGVYFIKVSHSAKKIVSRVVFIK